MFSRCKHDWETVSDIVLPSQSEEAIKMSFAPESVLPEFFSKTHILIMKCKNCGEVYKSVVGNEPR